MTNHFNDALTFFVSTFIELTLLFFVISIAISLIQLKLPASRVKRLLQGNRGYGIAVALGAITPFCSCSTLPMTSGLIQARAAFGPVMAFLFTSPLLNPFIVALFWVSFGASITLIYATFVLSLAILSGVLLEFFRFDRFIRADLLPGNDLQATFNPEDASSSCGTSVETKVRQKTSTDPLTSSKLKNWVLWQSLIQSAAKQLFSFVPYMAIGVAIGAVIHGYVPQSLIQSLSNQEAWWLIPLAAIVGVFLYIRASTMVPIAASLVAKGMSFGAIMSLTIGGAGASLPEMIMMKRLFHWPLIFAFISLVFGTACITGYAVNWLKLGVVS